MGNGLLTSQHKGQIFGSIDCMICFCISVSYLVIIRYFAGSSNLLHQKMLFYCLTRTLSFDNYGVTVFTNQPRSTPENHVGRVILGTKQL